MSDTFFMQEKKINMIDNKKEKLVVDNINLVYFMINKLRLNYKFDDYVDIGIIGLIKGVNAYDDSKNIKISTYLAKCIQNELLCHSRRMSVAKRRQNGFVRTIYDFISLSIYLVGDFCYFIFIN